MMKKLTTLLVGVLMSLSIVFLADASVSAAPSTNPTTQIVPTTKHISKKVYRKGRWVTKTTWRHGKKITKKVWVKSKKIGRGVGHKTHDVVMGKKKTTP